MRNYVGKIKRSPRKNKRNPHKAYGTRKRRNQNATVHNLIDAGAIILKENTNENN